MAKHDKYDVFIKMLEVIEQDGAVAAGQVTEERVTQITNIIERLEGNIVQEPAIQKEVVIEGDKIENVSQSVIATRGSIAKGVITIRSSHGSEVADAIETLEQVISGEAGVSLSEDDRKAALELLAEIAQQGSKPGSSKPVLRSIGQALWTLIEKAEPLSKVCAVAWKVIEKTWS